MRFLMILMVFGCGGQETTPVADPEPGTMPAADAGPLIDAAVEAIQLSGRSYLISQPRLVEPESVAERANAELVEPYLSAGLFDFMLQFEERRDELSVYALHVRESEFRVYEPHRDTPAYRFPGQRCSGADNCVSIAPSNLTLYFAGKRPPCLYWMLPLENVQARFTLRDGGLGQAVLQGWVSAAAAAQLPTREGSLAALLTAAGVEMRADPGDEQRMGWSLRLTADLLQVDFDGDPSEGLDRRPEGCE